MKSQILLTTLLTVTILSLMITTFFVVLLNDIRQVSFTSNFNEYYALSNTIMDELVTKTIELDQVDNDVIYSALQKFTESVSQFNLECEFQNLSCSGFLIPNKLKSNANLRTFFSLEDIFEVSNFELRKDDFFEFSLYKSGSLDFRGKIEFIIEANFSSNQVLLEIGLAGLDSDGKPKIWRDFLDLGNLSTPSSGSILDIYDINFLSESELSFIVDASTLIQFFQGRDDYFITHGFIVPRIRTVTDSSSSITIKKMTFLDLPFGYEIPPLLREYIIRTVNPDLEDSNVNLISKVPIVAQPLRIFDFVLFSENEIILE